MSIFEICMLICFGAAWPASIVKSYRSRSTGGKSPVFNYVIMTGYACGILHKIFYMPDLVLALYALDFLMAMTDLLLYYRNRRIERSTAKETAQA